MKSNNYYCVYVHICPNDKKYYGYTSLQPEKRWGNGRGYKNQSDFYNDILFYGWNNIKHLIIADNLSKEEAELLEEQLIRTNRTYDSNYGYNKFIGSKHTDEQKEAMSERMSGTNNPMFGRTHTDEVKAKLSKISKGKVISEEQKVQQSKAMSGKNNPMFGKTHSKEAKAKISKTHKGKILSDETKAKMSGANNHSAKKVICITTMMVFNTIKEGANYYSIDRSSITKCCKGKYKSAGKLNNQKLVWRYLYTKIL